MALPCLRQGRNGSCSQAAIAAMQAATHAASDAMMQLTALLGPPQAPPACWAIGGSSRYGCLWANMYNVNMSMHACTCGRM